MIAVDTNILVRYAVKDDPQQSVAATNFLADRLFRISDFEFWILLFFTRDNPCHPRHPCSIKRLLFQKFNNFLHLLTAG